MPLEPLRFEVSVPPSVNHMYRNVTVKGRRMRLPTARAKAWFAGAAKAIKDAKRVRLWNPLEEKTVVDLWVWWPDLRAHDCDNLNKSLMDALSKNGVVVDDKFCLPRWRDYDLDRKNPRVEVCVWPQRQELGLPTTELCRTRGTAPSCGSSPASSATGRRATRTTGP